MMVLNAELKSMNSILT
uniref:Uncharacterized protein n=1 Tax=Anguilla anguilla TaxID=7936 RepID=A0A0E9XUT5_ANGAN